MTLAADFPDPPPPPPANVQRFDASGKPTAEQAAYEARLYSWLKRLVAALKV